MDATVALPVVAGCLLVEGFFSGSEVALARADRAALQERADQGHRGAARALSLLSREDRLLGTCLVGTNLALVTATTVLSLWFASRGVDAPWLVALAFVPFALVFGEALPKTVYPFHADALAPIVSGPLRAAQFVFAPLLWLLSAWSRALTRLTGERRAPVTRSEILRLLDREPGIDPDEQRMIRGVFEITTISAEDCMTPLVHVTAVDADASPQEAVEAAVAGGHSRIPVYRERVDNIVGVVLHQDLLFGADEAGTVEALMRPVRFVPETKRVDALLQEMRRHRDQIVVVVDEYGGSTGIVTVEDIVEEIVGDIRDERDAEEPGIRKVADRVYRIPGQTPIDELEDAIGVSLPEGEYETVAGLLLSVLGRIPAVDETVVVGTMRFRIEEASERAIVQVLLTLH